MGLKKAEKKPLNYGVQNPHLQSCPDYRILLQPSRNKYPRITYVYIEIFKFCLFFCLFCFVFSILIDSTQTHNYLFKNKNKERTIQYILLHIIIVIIIVITMVVGQSKL